MKKIKIFNFSKIFQFSSVDLRHCVWTYFDLRSWMSTSKLSEILKKQKFFMIFIYFFMKTSNLPKSMKFWFPDLRIADLESSGPQLFKNQLFKIFKNFKIQKKIKKLPTIKQQSSTNNHQPLCCGLLSLTSLH